MSDGTKVMIAVLSAWTVAVAIVVATLALLLWAACGELPCAPRE